MTPSKNTAARSMDPIETLLGGSEGSQPEDLIQSFLREARTLLGMDVAYVAEFRGGERVYRYVDGETLPESVRVGTGDPLGETLAQRATDGSLAAVTPDTTDLRDVAEVARDGIGSFVGIPLHLDSGRLFGALCVFSGRPAPELDPGSEVLLHSFGRLIAGQLAKREEDWDDLRVQLERIDEVLRAGRIEMVFQPIFDIRTRRAIGAEALARFPGEPPRAPDAWFREAWTVGRGVDLELAAIGAALAHLEELPQHAFLAVNLSPETVASDRLAELLARWPGHRLVLEMPERAPVDDRFLLREAVDRLRRQGIRLAADDAGAGFENLSNILELRPDVVKFDVALTRDVDTDPLRQSLASSMVSFAEQIEALVIAEGIETEGELTTLRDLGFTAGQGYHLGRPGSPGSPA